MVDSRFHASAPPDLLVNLLAAVGFSLPVDDPRHRTLMIAGAEELWSADGGHLALAAHRDYLGDLRDSGAGAVIVAPALRDAVPETSVAIVSPQAQQLFVELLHRMYPEDTRSVLHATLADGGVAPWIEAGIRLGANVVIGPGAEIGEGSSIGANTVIGAGVTIGRDCVIGNNCSIDCAHLGNRVVVQNGARIGTEGFGFVDFTRSNRKVPQLGRVIIQDNVQVGGNTVIDRGALGDTVIGEGTKLDSLVEIGHNSRIGRNCLIASFTGISGSTVVEDGVLFGGGAASAGHLTIGRGSVVYAWGGVTKDVPPGSRVGGFPAEDIGRWRRGVATLRKLAKRGDEG